MMSEYISKMSEYVELKWNSHSSAFFDNLSSLRDQQIYTDVTLSCGNQFYPAHRLVLSSCSSFFSRALEMVNCRSPVLLLHGIEQFILEHLLMFMYDGQVTLAQRDLPSFLKAANWLGMKGLDLTNNNNEESKNIGKQCQPEFLDGQVESAKYFQIWAQLLSPLVSTTMEGSPSFDDMTGALRQMVGRLENEDTLGDMVVSNVTSLSSQVQPEIRFAEDAGDIAGNGLEPETIIKYENQDINMEEDVDTVMSSPCGPVGAGFNFLDTDDSSDSDNNFEGWENAAISVPDNLRNLQHQLSQSNTPESLDLSSCDSPSELSPRYPAEAESISDVLQERKRSLRCKHCKSTFSVREELAEHLRSHGHNFCYVCNKGFVSSKRFYLHMKLHEEGPLHCCTKCDFITRSKRGLSIHWAAMHGEEPPLLEEVPGNQLVEADSNDIRDTVSLLTCNLCGFSSNHVRGFKRHVTCMHSRKKWKEPKLSQDNNDSVLDNETSCSLYNCSMCDFSSSYRTGLKRHMTCKHLRSHLDETPEQEVTQEEDSSIARYYCNICRFTSVHLRGFKRHMSCMHDITDIHSDSQNEAEFSDTNEEDSMRIKLRSDKKTYDCPHCHRHFDNYRVFHKHKVLGCGRHRCRFCKMRYRASERKEYLAHLQLHKESEGTLRCNFCPFKTDRKRILSDHISIHTGAYRYCCPWCPFKCVRKIVLQAHLHRTHDKELSQEEVDNQSVQSFEDKSENNSCQLPLQNNDNGVDDRKEVESVEYN